MNIRRLFHKITNKITESKEKEIEVEREEEEVLSGRSSKTKNISERIYCRFCGKPNLQTQEICTKCGIRLNPPPSTIMKACTKCGLAANDDSIFCNRCGTRFEDA